jgi:hypothetical protein
MRKVTRRFALWQDDLDGGVCAVPEECGDVLRAQAGAVLVVEHRDRGGALTRQVFETSVKQDVEWWLGGVGWPADIRPGVLVTVSWQPADGEVVARTVALEEPVSVDGVAYFHEYDPRVVTRDVVADPSNRGKVLHAVRRQGRVFEDGSAVLAESALPALCGLGRGTRGSFLLRNAVDQLVREGYLTHVSGSVDAAGYPHYPAVDGQKPADMLFYAPLVEPIEHDADADRRDHWVNGFVRKLPPGARPSEKQLSLHERAVEEEQVDGSGLAPGYTFVRKHHRNG